MKPRQFFEDGIAKEVVIAKKTENIAKTGKPYWSFLLETPDGTDSMTMVDYGFRNELEKLNDLIDEGVTVISVLPVKTGEREYNGRTYDEFTYSLEITGKREPKAASVPAEDIDLNEVKF